eukprot:11158559-Lingulodinium_polyedra.AAC.1
MSPSCKASRSLLKLPPALPTLLGRPFSSHLASHIPPSLGVTQLDPNLCPPPDGRSNCPKLFS